MESFWVFETKEARPSRFSGSKLRFFLILGLYKLSVIIFVAEAYCRGII